MKVCNITLTPGQTNYCESNNWPHSVNIRLENLEPSREGKVKIFSGNSVVEVLKIDKVLILEKKYGGNPITLINVGSAKIQIITK